MSGLDWFLCGLAMLANAVLGIYHAGVEWQFWEGPQTCAGGSGLTGGLPDLSRTVVPCNKAAWALCRSVICRLERGDFAGDRRRGCQGCAAGLKPADKTWDSGSPCLKKKEVRRASSGMSESARGCAPASRSNILNWGVFLSEKSCNFSGTRSTARARWSQYR